MKTVKNSGCNEESENNEINAAPAQNGEGGKAQDNATAQNGEDGEAAVKGWCAGGPGWLPMGIHSSWTSSPSPST